MQRTLDFLKLHKEVAFATVGEGNLPKIRVFQIMKQEGTTLYFATSPKKAVYQELQVNPNIELLASANKVSVRCTGMADFNVDDDTKRWIYEHNDVLPRLYEHYDQLAYFSMHISEMDYYDLNPTPPVMKHYDLITGEVADGFVGERFSKK